jgi:hypothetical protein
MKMMMMMRPRFMTIGANSGEIDEDWRARIAPHLRLCSSLL